MDGDGDVILFAIVLVAAGLSVWGMAAKAPRGSLSHIALAAVGTLLVFLGAIAAVGVGFRL